MGRLRDFFTRRAWSLGSFDLDIPADASIPHLGPRDHQLFVSKSGQFTATEQWLATLGATFGDDFTLMWDDQFRAIGGQSHVDHWRMQYVFTRASYAMIVLMDTQEWTSRGQDMEIEDVMGRAMPVALCRTEPFASREMNERFETMLTGPSRHAPRCFMQCFDLCAPAAERELPRLATWIRSVAIPPVPLPASFKAGQTEEVRVRLWVPDESRQQPVDWSACQPRFVCNYGPHFVQLGTRVPYASKPGQLIFPVTPTGVAGEIRADITLPSRGVGHAVLTVGEPQASYAGEVGGLQANRLSDLFLWWDFVVE